MIELVNENSSNCLEENPEISGSFQGRNYTVNASVGTAVVEIAKMVIAGLIVAFVSKKCEDDKDKNDKDKKGPKP